MARNWKFIIVFVSNFAVTERIEIANLIIFVVKRSNMKRMSFLSVPYQNKMTKDFLYTPRHTVITSLGTSAFAVNIRLNGLTPGLTM
jgi:hypothetical protein